MHAPRIIVIVSDRINALSTPVAIPSLVDGCEGI